MVKVGKTGKIEEELLTSMLNPPLPLRLGSVELPH